jgi:hypothetical protein
MKDKVTVPEKTKEVFDFLRHCATDMRTVTYAEISSAVGVPAAELGPQLKLIALRMCSQRGLPWLYVIAVNADTRRPEVGLLPENVGRMRGMEGVWRKMVLQVFAYNWSMVEFDE